MKLYPILFIFIISLLKKAEYINGVSLVVVPRNQEYYVGAGELKPSEYLKEFILSQTADIPENIEETDEDLDRINNRDKDKTKEKDNN